jgi:hypothetical protein
MESRVELNPEIARLALASARQLAIPFRQVLARCVVEQAVTELDPELDLMLNQSESLSEIRAFARAFGANDVVVNEARLQVLPVDEDGTVEISTPLLSREYLSGGILVVRCDSTTSGAVIGYLDPENLIDNGTSKNVHSLKISFTNQPNFNLARSLSQVANRTAETTKRPSPSAEEYVKLLKEPERLSVEQQQNIVAAAATHGWVRQNLSESDSLLTPVPQILGSLADWSARVERLAAKLAPRFASVAPQKLKQLIRETGEHCGGQPESPEFKQQLLKTLVKEEFAAKLSPEYLLKVTKVVDLITAGKSAMESVKSFVSNQMALDLASAIAEKREQLGNFSKASVEELGLAFQTLRVQPAYATHSASPETIVEDVNNALILMEASTLLEEISEEI